MSVMANNRRTPEHQRYVEELRRSNAAGPMKPKNIYSRKNKSWKKEW